MTVQFSFQLPDKPGALAAITESLAESKINIDGIAGFGANGKGLIKITTNNPEATEEALQDADLIYEKQEVVVLALKDKPGQVAKLSRALADEGINIDAFYIAMGGNQVIHTDNLKRTKEIAKELGVL